MLDRESLSLLHNSRMQCNVEDVISGSTAKEIWLCTNVKEKTLMHSNYAL